MNTDDTFVFPTSSGQRRLWLLDQLIPGSPAYHVGWRITLTGTLDRGRLEHALTTAVNRHEALRTTFTATDGVPSQVVTTRADVRLTDLVESEVDTLVRHRFDLATGPLLRAGLAATGPDEHVLVLVVHHAVVDEWSCAILVDELARAYAGEDLPEPAIQYPDYAVWQREQADANAFADAARYWQAELAGIPTVLPLPTDRPRSAAAGHGADLVRDLEPVPDASFGTLLAVYQAMLHRLTGQEEFLIATPVAGRTRPETEHLVGFLANTLALPARIPPGTTFAELAKHTSDAVHGALANQDMPFEELVDLLPAERSRAHAPVAQVMFAVEPAPEPITVDGLTIAPRLLPTGGSKFDLCLTVEPGPDRWLARWNYDTDLFDQSTVEGFADLYAVLCAAVTADPDRPIAELPLRDGTRTVVDTPAAGTVTFDLARFGDAPAVADAHRLLTYRELDENANRLAHLLRANGVGPDVPVALCLERGVPVVTAILAVWRAGGGYLPLDPAWPADRLATMVTDAGCPVLVTHDAAAVALPGERTVINLDTADLAAQPATPPGPTAAPGTVSYLLYTSGSTGTPKGVTVTHGGVQNLLSAMDELLDLRPDDRVASITTPSFDVSTVELLVPLLRGARVTVVPAGEVSDGLRLRQRLIDTGATVVQGTPSAWRMLVTAGGVPAAVRLRISGGEAMTRELADALQSGGARLVDGYGPTETTVYSTAGTVPASPAPVRLGDPVGATTLHVLDPALRPVPDGVLGELYIGGAGVARGYLNRPGLTAAKFLPDPFSTTPGARLYATGDLVRMRSGRLEFLGRADHQVKVRGFRIELGEIESVLREHNLVRDAVVTVWRGSETDVRLVAYVLPGPRLDPNELRPWLSARLPDYLVPNLVMTLDAVPRTPTGKVDRTALPDPVWAPTRTRVVAPRDDVERRLALLWRDVLHLGPAVDLSVHDDFFALGGHSLTATQLLARVRTQLSVNLPLASVFGTPTIAGLGASIARAQAGDRSRTLLDRLDDLSDAEIGKLLAT
ncbi:non-ribosomal peptide synthetase [Actinophytocola algeriensis]|uniref:Amino acid adenylation domain-containing protein n=1 Tax=Actinophytocola algeriensis TaxID=1768010 RepID=A0A7W7VIA9_9PSEU|nr:non-ribosomal peptide synthetase [Actinophytocola algeriensis]MBB4911084.1 amino acid adenylation domain-containing protein [Actinophytocola algeriensis]MBE1479023.1 amino acid adenylation domain-containing protein [Actinophytocola algeriensis]